MLAVVGWELRRTFASRATWVGAALVFGVCLVLLRLSPQGQEFEDAYYFTHRIVTTIPWTVPFGLAAVLPQVAVLFGLFLPFVTADGVARDLNRRTHELLMSAALPSWAYIWGRYLASVLLAVGMAGLFLAAIVVMALALHLAQASVYPLLDLSGTLAFWALVVLSPTLLLASLGFALGTLFPRRSNLAKVGILFGWFVCGNTLPGYMVRLAWASPTQRGAPAWYTAYLAWDPTSMAGMASIVAQQFYRLADPIVGNTSLSDSAVLEQVRLAELQTPDLSSFLWPHLAWVGVGVLAVVVASVSFKRFRMG